LACVSISPITVGGTAATTESDKKANEERAKTNLKVNSVEPTTNLQLRLADGSRIVGHFNHVHTLHDVRMFIITARPQYEIQPFVLMTAFPNKALSDESATLKELNLLNAVIIQRITG
jgi:UBX domain-containing protein 1